MSQGKNKRQRKASARLVERSHWTYASSTKRAVASDTSTYRTRLNLTQAEETALTRIGGYLFSLQLEDWQRCKDGDLTMKERKNAISDRIGTRYAYAIVKRNDEQKKLQERNIQSEQHLLEREIETLEKRDTQARAWLEQHPNGIDSDTPPAKKEYNPLSYAEHSRLDYARCRLEKLDDGWMDVTFGGKQQHRIAMRALARGDENAQELLATWKKSRYAIRAIGDSSHACGNSVVKVDQDGILSVLIPEAIRQDVQKDMGWAEEQRMLVIAEPVTYPYGNEAVQASVRANRCVTNTVTFIDGEWAILTQVNSGSLVNTVASAKAAEGGSVRVEGGQSFQEGVSNPAVVARNAAKKAKKSLEGDVVRAGLSGRDAVAARKARYLGVDVNAGHVDCCVCDVYGNPVGKPLTIPYRLYGSSKQTKSSVLHALDRVRHVCELRHVECVFIEDLKGFLDSKSRVLNDGGRDFRRVVSSIPCGELRDWLIRKLTFGACHVEFVAAAYTSRCASAFWFDVFSSGHHGAALMVARRGLGLGLFRRVPGGSCSSCVTGEDVCRGCLGESGLVAFSGGPLSGGAVTGSAGSAGGGGRERPELNGTHLGLSLRRRHASVTPSSA